MARLVERGAARERIEVTTRRTRCVECGGLARADYRKSRKVITLTGIVQLEFQVRRCHRSGCRVALRAIRPEDEGRWALPRHEVGLDIIAHVGALRYRQARSIPAIHATLRAAGVSISERTVTNTLDRYDELVSMQLTDPSRVRERVRPFGRAILALDGLAPDVGHEVLWVIRECLSGEVLLARSLLGSGETELIPLLEEVKTALGDIPVIAVVSDGQRSIRNAVKKALPDVPHQLCQFHYLREAARPLYEADRHLKKELKKRVRGVRRIERAVEGVDTVDAKATRAYAAAVRSALTDDSRPPLKPPGRRLKNRLQAISESLQRLEKRGGKRGSAPSSRGAR